MQDLATSFYSLIWIVDGRRYGFVGKVEKDKTVEKPYVKFGNDVFINLEDEDLEGEEKESSKRKSKRDSGRKVNPFSAYKVSLIINPEARFKINGGMFPKTEQINPYEIFHAN